MTGRLPQQKGVGAAAQAGRGAAASGRAGVDGGTEAAAAARGGELQICSSRGSQGRGAASEEGGIGVSHAQGEGLYFTDVPEERTATAFGGTK